MGWKIVEIEEGQYLSLFLDNLVIEYQNNKITLALSDLDLIISQNIKLNLTTQLLCKLAEYNIAFIICDKNHYPKCFLSNINGNYNSLKIFQRQLQWTPKYKCYLWTNIIKQKITNQLNFIKHYLSNLNASNLLKEFLDEVKDFDITNREGHAAKVYWHATYGVSFSREEECNLNVLLNYGYAILNAMISRSIIKKGLDPRLSLYHKSFSNYFALSSDFIEVWRNIVDCIVFNIYKQNKNFNLYDAKQIVLEKVATTKLCLNQKWSFLNNAIDEWIDAVVNENSLPQLEFNWNE